MQPFVRLSKTLKFIANSCFRFADPSALHLLRNVLEKLYKNELRYRAAPLTQPATNVLKSTLHHEHEVTEDGGNTRLEFYHIRNWLFCVVKIVAELDWSPAVCCDNIIPAYLSLFLLDLLACYFRRQDTLDIDQFMQLNNIYDSGDFVANLLQSDRSVDNFAAGEAGTPTTTLFIAQFCARCLLQLRISGACPPFFPKGTFVHVPGITDAELALPSVGTTHLRQQQQQSGATAPNVPSATDTEDAKALNIVERLIAHDVKQYMQILEKRDDAGENPAMLVLTRAALNLIPDSGSVQKVGSILTATTSNIKWDACAQVPSSAYSTVRCLVAVDFIDSLLLNAEFETASHLFSSTFTSQRLKTVSEYFMPRIQEAVERLNVIFSTDVRALPKESDLNSDLLRNCPLLCDCSSLVSWCAVEDGLLSMSDLFSLLGARVENTSPPTKTPIASPATATEKSDAELLLQLVNTTDASIFQRALQRISSSPSSTAASQEHCQKIVNFIPFGLRASLEKELEKLVKKQHALLLLGKAFQCMHFPSSRRAADIEPLQNAVEFFALAQDLCSVVLSESRRKVLQSYHTLAELQKFCLLINSASDPTMLQKQQLTTSSRTLSAELVRWRDDEKKVTKKILTAVVDRSLSQNAVPPELFFACGLTTYNMQNLTYLATLERTFPRDDFIQLISLLTKCEREFQAVVLETKRKNTLTHEKIQQQKTALLSAPPPVERVNLTCLWLTVYQAFGGQVLSSRCFFPAPDNSAEIRPLSANINANVINDVCSFTRNPCVMYILTTCLAQLWTLTATNSRGFSSSGTTQYFPKLWPNRVDDSDNLDFVTLGQIFSITLERALNLHATLFNTSTVPSRNLSAIQAVPICFVRELLQIQRDYFLIQKSSGDVVESMRACARTCIDLSQFYGTAGFADIFPACAPFPVSVLRRLVLCCEELNYFTHVALLAQYLFLCSVVDEDAENHQVVLGGEHIEVDEQIVREMRVLTMRALQERSSYDACDELYEFFFDVDMLEMLIHHLFQRNELEKKLKAMRVIGNPAINVHNEAEFLMWERMKLLRRYLRLLKEEFQPT